MASIPLHSTRAARPFLFSRAIPWRVAIEYAAVIVLFTMGAFFAHEFGHALVAQIFGARVVMFNVLGMQWYPTLEWMPQLGFGGYVYWWAPPDRTTHSLIVMAGSNFTILLALGAAVALNVFRPRGSVRVALGVMSFYFLDSLIKIFPVLGIIPRGWNYRFTRTFSEAYYAAVNLGFPSEIYIGAILVTSLVCALLVVRAPELLHWLLTRSVQTSSSFDKGRIRDALPRRIIL